MQKYSWRIHQFNCRFKKLFPKCGVNLKAIAPCLNQSKELHLGVEKFAMWISFLSCPFMQFAISYDVPTDPPHSTYNSCLSIYIALFKHRLTKDDFISYTDDLLLIKIFPETTSEPIHRNKGYPKLASGFLICRHTINMTSLADDILIVITRF